MTFRFFSRTRVQRRPASKDPEQVMRAFWRTVERIAPPRPKGGGKLATSLVREKP